MDQLSLEHINLTRRGARHHHGGLSGRHGGVLVFCDAVSSGGLGLPPLEARLAFLPTTLPSLIVAMTVPQLVRRFGNAKPPR
jgi:hypothetical protein